jgi:SH3-like domain-containing protein
MTSKHLKLFLLFFITVVSVRSRAAPELSPTAESIVPSPPTMVPPTTLVSPTLPTIPPTSAPTTTTSLLGSGVAVALAPDMVCITLNETSLYLSSDPKKTVGWIVNRFMPLSVRSKKPGWVEVEDLDQKIYWVEERMVTTEHACAVVKSKTVIARRNADLSPDSALDLIVDRYTPLKVIAKKDDWTQVEDDLGESYWIQNADLWITPSVTKK